MSRNVHNNPVPQPPKGRRKPPADTSVLTLSRLLDALQAVEEAHPGIGNLPLWMPIGQLTGVEVVASIHGIEVPLSEHGEATELVLRLRVQPGPGER